MREIPLDGQTDQLARLGFAERRNGLFAYRVDGWSPWRVTRHYVHLAITRHGVPQPPLKEGRRVISALAATIQLLAILTSPAKVGLMVKTQRSGLRRADEERYRDVYFDSLLAAGDHHFKLEATDSPDFERQARAALYPRHLNPVVFTFWGRVLGTLLPAAGEFPTRASSILRDEVSVDVPARVLRRLISTVYWQARLFGLLLRRLQPAAVLVSNTGEYGLILACRRAGIPVVELQHGVFDAAHPDAVPNWTSGTGFELILPDVLAVRGRYWIEQLAGTRQADIAEPVGSEPIDAARERRVLRRAKLDQEAPVRRLVLTSQGIDSERLAAWIAALIAAAPADQAWQLVIKLHPTYDFATTAFDRLALHPCVTIVPGDEQPNVFDLLAEADLHMSISSACLFEGAALGVPSLVIPLLRHEDVLFAVNDGLFRLAKTPADAWTLSIASIAEPARYCEPDFRLNMRRLLCIRNARPTGKGSPRPVKECHRYRPH